MRPSTFQISAVVVSYNVADLLRACLESLERARSSGELDEIIVIDSDSNDGSVAMVRTDFPRVKVERRPNKGYGAAANAGYALASGALILTLNPDTVVCPGAIERLASVMARDEQIGLVGPTLRYPDGEIQPTRRRFPTAWTPLFESTVFEEWFPRNCWVRHYRMLDEPVRSRIDSESVDWLVGAAFLVRRSTIEATGGFDESFFLYGEELDWCYRIRRHGWEIHYVPEATIVHHEAASTSQDRPGSRLLFDRGRVRAQRVLHGDAVARRTARLLRLHFAIQLVREGLKWMLGHRRDMRRQRVAQYWMLVRSRLDD